MREAKFTELAEKLMKAIAKKEFQPGDPFPSQNELAEKYGLSRSCVQKALDILDNDGLLERRPGKGIFLRDKHVPVENRKLKIAYIMPDYVRVVQDTNDNYGLHILSGIEEASRQMNANLIFKRISLKSEAGILNDIVRDIDVDGVIIHKDISDNDIRSLSILDFPVVVVGRISTLSNIGAAAPNFIDSFLGIFRRLAAQGIKKTVFIYKGSETSTLEVPVLKKLSTLCGIGKIRFCDYGDEPEVHKIVNELIKHGALPEVFCCFNDWGAKHVISALNAAGKKIPGDTGIIGALDFDFAQYLQPSLTTLTVEPLKIGQKAVELLSCIINGRGPFTERIPMMLTQRESFIFKK